MCVDIKWPSMPLVYHDVKGLFSWSRGRKRIPVTVPVITNHSAGNVIIAGPLDEPMAIQIVLALVVL